MLSWKAQERPTSCVAACVRMVLTGFREDWTEAELRKVLGRARLGITLAATVERLVRQGATAELQGDWGIDDLRDALRRNRYPIIGVERHPLGHPSASHAIVAVQVTGQHVQALDPLDGPRPQRYGVRTFELAWQLAGRDVLIIDAPPRRPSA